MSWKKLTHSGSITIPALLVLGLVLGGGCSEDSGGPNDARGDNGSAAGVPEGWVAISLKLPRPRGGPTPKDQPENVRLREEVPRKPFHVPEGTTNVALKKPVSASDREPVIGTLSLVTDGDKEAKDGRYVELGPGVQFVQIDLGAVHRIHAIAIWHHHLGRRIYRDVVVRVANDPDLIENVITVFNNDYDNTSGLGIGKDIGKEPDVDLEYYETHRGELIDVSKKRAEEGSKELYVEGRYVRCYTNGSTEDDLNHCTEVEVYGLPVK